MTYGGSLIGRLTAVAVLIAGMAQAPAHGASASVTGLADVNFGTINAPVDQSNSQNLMVCSYRNAFNPVGYSVTANGSGSGGAFELSSGAATLAYDVQWSDSANQTSGTMLQPGVAVTGFGNGAPGWACRFLQYDNASLVVTIRAADLTSATAGNYSGTLQITIVPE